MKFYLLCGLPGSGKSTTAKRLHHETGAVVISSDAIRLMLTGGVYPSGSHYESFEPLVWQLAEQSIRVALLAGHDVVFDTTALTREFRDKWARMARKVRKLGEISIEILWHDGDYDSGEHWQRERGISTEEYARIREKLQLKMEIPTPEEMSRNRQINQSNVRS